jgi:hypothetical protein
MHTDQLFPTYLIQPGVLPPPPHTGGRTPKDPRGFQDLLLKLRTRISLDTCSQSGRRKPLGSLRTTFLPSRVPRLRSASVYLASSTVHRQLFALNVRTFQSPASQPSTDGN